MFDVARPTWNQIGLENAAQVPGRTDLDQVTAEMGPADQARIRGITHRAVESAIDANLLEFRRHPSRTLDTARANAFQAGIQPLVTAVERVAENMDLQRLPLDRDLHAVDQTHAGCGGCQACRGKAVERVVVGQRQQVYAVARRTLGNVGSAQKTVRAGGMAMQIAVEHGRRHSWPAQNRKPRMIAQAPDRSLTPKRPRGSRFGPIIAGLFSTAESAHVVQEPLPLPPPQELVR